MRSTRPSLLQSPRFWWFFLIVSLLAVFAAMRLMQTVEPSISSNITFSRQQAEDGALALQQKLFPELRTERSAATFFSDNAFMYYVQLEAGGVPQYARFMEQVDAVTHGWRVRRFTPAQQQELRVDFGMQGDNIGFALTIPDEEPGAALSEAEARAIAEQGAREFVGERFASYQPIETRVTTQSSGRVDHSFTYEHHRLTAGEARFRYELRVAGDQLVRVTASKFIPQGFMQRFGEIRSLNTQISQLASLVAQGGFGVALLISGIWLFRRGHLQYRPALWPAVIAALGLAAANISNLPTAWLNYQTTSSEQTFLLQQISGAMVSAIGLTLLFSLVYCVAEALTRVAFADHPRLWDSCRTEVAGSSALVGRVLGAYGWAALFLLYAMVFSLFSTRVLGWWQPTGIDSDPNILASMRPALTPIFNALQAGTIEECLFRAVPLSLAVLFGERYGIRRPALVVMMIVQCVVFAAAHASYPNLPGYSRLVELLLPALVFGLVYLRFGLLIGMLAHFEYDLFLMSLPIFDADSASLWLDRILVILAGLAPLLLVAWAWKRQGALLPLAAQWRNGTTTLLHELPSHEAAAPEAAAPAGNALALSTKTMTALVVVSLAVFAYPLLRQPRMEWPFYQVSRSEAFAIAERTLTERGVRLQGEWRDTVTLSAGLDTGMNYVWRESGTDVVQKLLGTYLNTPPWIVTWRRFDGPVEERTEFWRVRIGYDGTVREVIHGLPEASAGASIDADRARQIAASWISEQQWGDVNTLQLKSVNEAKRPARSDWQISYTDSAAYDHEGANATIAITLAGDQVVGYARRISVPEAWARERQQLASARLPYRIVTGLAVMAFGGLLIAGYLRGDRKHRRFSLRVAWPWMLLVALNQLGRRLLTLDAGEERFQTTTPWLNQMLMLLAGSVLTTVLVAGVLFLAAQAVYREQPRAGASLRQDLMLGAVLGIGLLGLSGLLQWPRSDLPYAVGVGELPSALPALAALLRGLGVGATILVTVALSIFLSRFMQRRWEYAVVAVLGVVLVISYGLSQEASLGAMGSAFQSLVTVLITVLLLRRQQVGVALTMGFVVAALGQLSWMRSVHPDAGWHALIMVAASLAAGFLLVRHWYTRPPGSASGLRPSKGVSAPVGPALGI